VAVYRLYIYGPRRFERAKKWLLKKVLTVAEYLAN